MKIIGNMTGNSMDAIDLVLTDFSGDKMTDICSFSVPFSKDMQEKMAYLRMQARSKTRTQLEQISHFQEIHDAYVHQVADAIDQMLIQNKIDKKTIDAIGFHGKTLDHNPPSVAYQNQTMPYTLQIGSGQMLADLTGIRVVYDFRSAPIQAGFDGAPLAPPHNAHIAATEGDGCYYNGGNTSNLAWVIDGVACQGSDAGPFNEYIDRFITHYTSDTYDKDGTYGTHGNLDTALLQVLFDTGRFFYDLPLPKSGDPQYYHTDDIFQYITQRFGIPDATAQSFADTVHTLEYFAAYIAFQALTLTDATLRLPPAVILFGGGWKNPVVRQSFELLLAGKGYVLPEHQQQFHSFLERFDTPPMVKYSSFGEFMEARLFADLARYKLENKGWKTPEVIQSEQTVVCGVVAQPNPLAGDNKQYTDCVNQACCGW